MSYVPDTPPAKLWELLRRNPAFAKAAASLSSLGESCATANAQLKTLAAESKKAKRPPDPRKLATAQVLLDRAFTRGFSELSKLDDTNPLAAGALRWLVPQPVFVASRARAGIRDLAQPCAWGPVVVGRPAKRNWRQRQEKTQWFTCKTPWRETPEDFRLAFAASWNLLTAPKPVWEPDFLRGWNLAGLLNRVVVNNTAPTQQDLENVFAFDELASYRVFALPHLLTKKDVRRGLAELKRQLLKKLPDTRGLLGTPRCWEVFVAVEQFMPPGANNRTQAVSDYLRSNIVQRRFAKAEFSDADQKRWLRNRRLVPPAASAPKSEQDEFRRAEKRYNAAYKAEQASSRHIPRWVAFIDTLIGATFPVMNMEILLQPTPS